VSAETVILLPGLAANAAVFAPQCEAFPDIVVPPWLDPEPGESLAEYAGRFARRIDPGRRCIVGGMSFGGIVATELCQHLDVERCLLIGSIRHPRYLPKRARYALAVARRLPVWMARLPIGVARGTRRLVEPLLPPVLGNLWGQLGAADAELMIWSLRALAAWESRGSCPCPIEQIHGSRDRVFPVSSAPGAEIVPDGTHVLTLTRPDAVNGFLAKWTR